MDLENVSCIFVKNLVNVGMKTEERIHNFLNVLGYWKYAEIVGIGDNSMILDIEGHSNILIKLCTLCLTSKFEVIHTLWTKKNSFLWCPLKHNIMQFQLFEKVF